MSEKIPQIERPKTVEPLFTRIQGIRESLLATHKAGKGSPNEVIGNERELFLRNYLEAVYPKPFRFASGFVMDKAGNKSGQLDIIAEKIHSISFPAQPSSNERLYLAEMVSAVISVKSSLFAQWSQIEKEIEKLNPIKPNPNGFFQINSRTDHIPFFIISYSGGKTVKKLAEKLNKIPMNSCLEAVLILDENIIAVRTNSENWKYNQNSSSFSYFICKLHDAITHNFIIGDSIWEYACEVTEKE